MKCQKCGYENNAGSGFCWQCGANLSDQRRRNTTELIPPGAEPYEYDNRVVCPECGRRNRAGASFCEECGAPLYEDDYGPGGYGPVDPGSRSIIPTVLLGVGIGIAVLILIFGILHFVRSGDEEEEETTATTTTEEVTEETTTEEITTTMPTTTVPPTTAGPSTSEEALYQPGAPEIFPDSSSRYLTVEEARTLSRDEAQKAINDIYARNGYDFDTDWIDYYYRQQPWYYPVTSSMEGAKSNMNEYERYNIEFLDDYN